MTDNIIQVESNVFWLPIPNEVAIIQTNELPPEELISSAVALVFDGNHLLMTKLKARGWDVPGGHIEMGETPEEAMRREVYEETGVTLGAMRLFAVQRIRLLGDVPANYRYPFPDSFQAVFLGRPSRRDSFQTTDETSERAFFAPEDALNQWWVQKNHALYEAAQRRIGEQQIG